MAGHGPHRHVGRPAGQALLKPLHEEQVRRAGQDVAARDVAAFVHGALEGDEDVAPMLSSDGVSGNVGAIQLNNGGRVIS